MCWRCGLSVKSTCSSRRETRFNEQYPQYDLQPSLTSIDATYYIFMKAHDSY